MRKFLSTLIVLSAFAISPAYAEDATAPAGVPDEAAMKKVMELTTPGEMHKLLEGLAGKWTYTSKMWMMPEAPAEESAGTAENEMAYGGKFLEMEVKGTMKCDPVDIPVKDQTRAEEAVSKLDGVNTTLSQQFEVDSGFFQH